MRRNRTVAPALDLSRLQTVAATLGYEAPGNTNGEEQLRQLNRALGERLPGCSPGERAGIAQALAEADSGLPDEIRKPHGGVAAGDIEQLRQKGCLELGQMLGADQVSDIRRHLAARQLLVGRSPDRSEGQAASLEAVPGDKTYACYAPLDLWSSPHLLEFAAQDKLLDLAQGYLGCTPTLCFLNAFWSLPDRPSEPQRQSFHRDLEDFRSLAVFVLLTPVEAPAEGGHHYVEGSHDIALLEASLRADGLDTKVDYLVASPFIPSLSMRLFHRSARRFHGPAGTAFCADPYGLHRTVAPRLAPQLLLELRFGTFFNESLFDMRLSRDTPVRGLLRRALASWFGSGAPQVHDVVRRIPATPRHRYVFRHMLRALFAEL